MMTSDENNHLVFRLGPTACGYDKLGEYFWKLQTAEIDALWMRGDFGENSAVREVAQSKTKD